MNTNQIDTSYADPSKLSNPGTIGELVHVLKKLDPETPIKILADHGISSCTIKGEERCLHNMHLEIDFNYVD